VQAVTRYMNCYGNALSGGLATESDAQVRMPKCRVKSLSGWLDATPAAGETVTLTVRKNAVDTALTCQFTNGGAQRASDLANGVDFAEGDLLSIKSVSSAAVGTRIATASMVVGRRL